MQNAGRPPVEGMYQELKDVTDICLASLPDVS